MKKTVKVISIILLAVMLLTVISSCALATDMDPSQFKGGSEIEGSSQLVKVGTQIVNVIRLIGSLISVGVLVVLGIKYMLGSAEEKAEYKKTMIPYIIGAVLVFAGTWIASAIYNFANGIGA